MAGGETEEKVSAWTTDTLHQLVIHIDMERQRQLNDLRLQLDERYAAQTSAVAAAFQARETAMNAALMAAEKAVNAALASAKEAVTKAETAANDRFSAVNEFRAQLADERGSLMGRSEADARFHATTEKFDTESQRNSQRFADAIARLGAIETNTATRLAELDARVSSRLDLMAGAASGRQNSIAFAFAAITILIAVVATGFAVIGFN